MAIVTTDNQHYAHIAQAIRAKGGSGQLKPAQMAAAVTALYTSGVDTSDATATPADLLYGKTAYADGQKITGAFRTTSVVVNPGDMKAAGQGEYAGYGGFDAAYGATDDELVPGNIKSGVDIFGVTGSYSGESPVLQSKTVAPSASRQSVTPDSGYDGLSSVTVNAVQTETKTATPSASVQNITPTAGKYLTKVTVNAVQTEIKTATPSASVQNITPTAGKFLSKVTVNAVPTETKTATPSESQQTVTPASGKFLSSVTVNAVASNYVGSGVTRKSAQTYTPGTTDQTISANQYLNGAQTVKGDADLVPGNIKNGVSIFGVTGTHAGTQMQTWNGTITTNSTGAATINCGFMPDLLVVDLGLFEVNPETGEISFSTLTYPFFAHPTVTEMISANGGAEKSEYIVLGNTYFKTATGVSITILEQGANYSVIPMAGVSFDCHAYKFT